MIEETKTAAVPPESNASGHLIVSALGTATSLVIICVALWFLHRELAGTSLAHIAGAVRAIPATALLAAIAFAACSYAILTAYDATGLRYLGKDIPYMRSAVASFMAYAVGHNVGFAALSGGSIRYRMYSLAGLSTSEIARLIVFVTATFALGAAGLLGVALLTMPASQTAMLNLPSVLTHSATVILLGVPVAYLVIAFTRRQPVALGSWHVQIPAPPIALAQLLISTADLVCAAATIYVLLAPSLQIGFLPFLGIYLLAMAAGIVSSIPGGIGVFEAVLMAALPEVDRGALLGGIVVYRLVYYVAPLSLALVLLVGNEVRQHRQLLQRPAEKAGELLLAMVPQVAGGLVFLAGIVLLVSGASPAVEARLMLIERGIPLPLLELSNLAGSVVGVGLLILASGLFSRLKTAFAGAIIALLAGISISLLKGLDYEEALILAVIATTLWLSRHEFYRLGSIAGQPFSWQWGAAITAVLAFALWIGMISYRHVVYTDELWWQFAFDAEAPRMLRASFVAALTALTFVVWRALRLGPDIPRSSDIEFDGEAVRTALLDAGSASANAALLGDKRFLWSSDRRAFIMYGVSGSSWIALGDPVGPASYHRELAWQFRELVDRHHGRTVFYEVTGENLSLYVDLGLSLSKLGEDARVPLESFSLQGSQRADLRQADNKAKKFGAVFEVIPRANVAAIVSELRRVSDSWLADKKTAEKCFSLGFFSESYIVNFDCAVVRVKDKIVGFANLWPAPARAELSVDLMRYDLEAPKGVMDYLFTELMLWGAVNGYRWFSLGMAPLSGLEQRPLAPLWHKLGHLLFTHGESFYNFEGLRNYKQKFNPVWQPRYLACPGGWWQLPHALLDASRLVSGGVSGMLAKK